MTLECTHFDSCSFKSWGCSGIPLPSALQFSYVLSGCARRIRSHPTPPTGLSASPLSVQQPCAVQLADRLRCSDRNSSRVFTAPCVVCHYISFTLPNHRTHVRESMVQRRMTVVPSKGVGTSGTFTDHGFNFD